MSNQYNGNEYDQQAKQSGQDFLNQALNAGYDNFIGHNGRLVTPGNKAINPTIGNTGTETIQGTNAGASGIVPGELAAGTSSAASTAAGAAEAGAGVTATGTGAVTGTAAAAGAPTGGIGALIVLALSGLKAGADKVKAETADIEQITDTNKESRMPFFIFCAIGILVVTCSIILLVPSCAMFFPQLMERDSSYSTEVTSDTNNFNTFFSANSDKNEFFRQILSVDSYNISANNLVQEYRQIDNTNIDIFKSIIDHAIWNAFNKHALSYCTEYTLLEALNFITDKDMTFEDKMGYILFFDAEAALENYRSKQYPYTAVHADGLYYTIGDYLDGKIPDSELNNILNYGEIIAVLSQSEKCSSNNFSYSSFYDMLTSEQAEMLLFEICFNEERTWSHEVIEEVPETATENTSSETNGGLETDKEADTTISPPDQESEKQETEKTEDNSDKESDKEDNGITIEPVIPGRHEGNSIPKEMPQPPHQQSKGDKKDTGKNENKSNSKTKPDEEPKNKNNGKNGSKRSSSAKVLKADTSLLICQSVSKKTYESAQPPADTEQNTLTRTNLGDPEADIKDNNSLAENIATRYIYKYGFYYDCKIAPYGLLELYTIAGIDPDDLNTNEFTMRNIDVLNISETWLRARISDVSLGTSVRSPMQYLNSDLISNGIEGLFSNSIYYNHAVDIRDQLSCNYIPDGQSVILDMYGYINQGQYPDNYRGKDGRGQSIKAAGCCDCSYAMIAMYLNRTNYDIVSVSRNYVANNNFQGKDFLSDIGLEEISRDEAYSASKVVGYLTEGLPVMLHISGKWVYNGITYHNSTNGHFLVIMGFDDTGFYVYDPGSNRNTIDGPIPYAAFSHVSGKSIRVISKRSTFVPHYLVNTYLEQ